MLPPESDAWGVINDTAPIVAVAISLITTVVLPLLMWWTQRRSSSANARTEAANVAITKGRLAVEAEEKASAQWMALAAEHKQNFDELRREMADVLARLRVAEDEARAAAERASQIEKRLGILQDDLSCALSHIATLWAWIDDEMPGPSPHRPAGLLALIQTITPKENPHAPRP